MRSRAPLLAAFAIYLACCTSQKVPAAPVGVLLEGEAALGDHTQDQPGVRRKITIADLPQPYATDSAENGAKVVPRPDGAWPRVPAGFQVELFASGLAGPRQVRVAPNGDLFVAESRVNRVRVLRDADGDGKAETMKVFAEKLNQPFGVTVFPPVGAPTHLVVANTDSVVRFPYAEGDLEARGPAEPLIGVSGGGLLRGGGHWTRDVVFSRDGAKMYVSIGSRSNVSDDESENDRARVFVANADGKDPKVFATGLRNPVGLAVHPETGELWTTVNERDELGDHLVPDFVTHVAEGGFYGWPWFYLGPHQDPRHQGKHPELKDKSLVPDVLLQSHSAALGMIFYGGQSFPAAYKGSAFVALHGSWNRARRTGYKVVQLPIANGRATGEYVDFMTGFVTDDSDVWGRPVGVAVGRNGELFVTDDAGGCVWRVTYKG